jgi:hypothetical protein
MSLKDNIHLIIFGVPENHTSLRAFRLDTRVYNSVGTITPLVIWPEIGKVDIGVNSKGQPQ